MHRGIRHSSMFLTLGFLASTTPSLASQSAGSSTTDHVKKHPHRITTQAAKAQHTQAATSEQLTVKGRRASVVASSATKSDTPLIDTAQSITVITRNEMDIRGVLSLNQAVRYAAGITPDLRGGIGTRYDQFLLRGFTVPTFLDGLKVQDSPTGYAVAQTDTSRLDRIEMLKGPASALYGQSSPGGLAALSSKLATDQRSYGNVTATGGMFDLYRVDSDVGGYANNDGSVRWRLYGTANGQHTQLARTGSRRFSISPTFTFGGNGPTTLTILGNYQYDPEGGTYGGVPLVGSLKRASFGYLPRNFYDGDVSFEKFNRRQGAFSYFFNHRFNDDWSFSSRGRYDDIRVINRSTYDAGYWEADGYTLPRYAYGTKEHTYNMAYDSQFKGHVRTGPLKHTLMTGFDYMWQRATETYTQGDAPSLNALHPDYHMAFPAQTVGARYLTNSHQIGIYAQDEIRWRGLVLNGSLRNDWYRSDQKEYLAGSDTRQNPSQITWRASALYHFKFGLAPYISYSTSFQPQSGFTSKDGGKTLSQANPTLGKQLEGGVKYQIPGTPILLTAAGFHIEQSNVLVAVGNLPYGIESGKVHSDGFEFEAHADVYKNLMLEAAVSVQHVHDDSTGKPLIQSGKGNASLFAFYTMPSGPLKGFGFGGGMRYTAKAYGGQADYGSVWVPQYALFDGSLRYDLSNLSPSLRGWTASASVRNLFDKHYVSNCLAYASYGQAFCYYGERRNAQASIGFSW
ncbi:TonB-dependent siderophore receptor [Acetobacter sp. DsW_059]|uniref:TonB-dependent siderophore receptor n=1 Tax=Acetobacter sp. DsW_059 TaxID=1670661 RepID=UPI000B6F8DD3|nr:TonB-dependent siderophore receptor [Acetobacter sp. DsW_059]OUJ09695.1 TonB-dependent receptor [Acetobacter sp. DsW_059]